MLARNQMVYLVLLWNIVLMNQTELAALSGALDDQSAQGSRKNGGHDRSTARGRTNLGLQAGHDVVHVFVPVQLRAFGFTQT